MQLHFAFAMVIVSTAVLALPAGQPRANVAFDVSGSSSVTLGEPVLVDLIVSNLTDDRIDLDLGKNYRAGLRVEMWRPSGGLSAPRRRGPEPLEVKSTPGLAALMPRVRYAERLLLDEWGDFNEVGTYRVSIDIRGLTSTNRHTEAIADRVSFAVSVADADELRLREAALKLVRAASDPEGGMRAVRATQALARIENPLAIEPMMQAIALNVPGETDLLETLKRIGSAEAIAALEAVAQNGLDYQAEKARNLLEELRKKP